MQFGEIVGPKSKCANTFNYPRSQKETVPNKPNANKPPDNFIYLKKVSSFPLKKPWGKFFLKMGWGGKK